MKEVEVEGHPVAAGEVQVGTATEDGVDQQTGEVEAVTRTAVAVVVALTAVVVVAALTVAAVVSIADEVGTEGASEAGAALENKAGK